MIMFLIVNMVQPYFKNTKVMKKEVSLPVIVHIKHNVTANASVFLAISSTFILSLQTVTLLCTTV